MATLNGFLNPQKIETAKVVISDRFCGDDGEPLEWELRCVSGEEIAAIQDKCSSLGKDGKMKFDNGKFQNELLARSVVDPNPNAADIQDAYGVTDAARLFGKMLTGAEYLALYTKAAEINGLNKDLGAMVQDAKN